MKPAVSAMNDWLKTLIVHKSFNFMHIYKSDAHLASIELAYTQQYDYVDNHYETTNIAGINLEVREINGKLTNIVSFWMTMPTGFVESRAGDQIKRESYFNISIKNLIDFVNIFKDKFSIRDRESLYYFYNIPNHNNMGFATDYKPFKGTFEQYFKDHQKEYNKFLEYRESLFDYLERCSRINTKKKLIKNISKKEK